MAAGPRATKHSAMSATIGAARSLDIVASFMPRNFAGSQRRRVTCVLPQSARPDRRTGQRLARRPFARQRTCRQRRTLRTEPVGAPAAPRAVAELSADDRTARHDAKVRLKAESRPFARLRTRYQTNNRGNDHARAEQRRTAHSVSLSASGGRSNKDCFGSRLRPPHRPVRR
jgi:hypothetical protein